MATAKILGSSALFLSNLLALFVFSPVAAASYSNYSLVVDQITSLSLTPSLLVEKSPAFKPGTNVFCERVDITGLSRLENIRKFAHSVKVNVSYVLPVRRPPIVHICFHSYFRIIFLISGIALMTIAWALSKSLLFYYGSAMTVGVILVILMILFQGMKLLPTGRKSSLAMVIYASTLGVGAMIFRDVPRLLLHLLFGETGISEEYNPLIIFITLFLILVGAWLGFWAVRKLVLSDDGSIDEGVTNFVAWSIWIIGAVMIWQSSVDPLLLAVNLVSGILVSIVLRNMSLNMLLLHLFESALGVLLHLHASFLGLLFYLYESAHELVLHLYEFALDIPIRFRNLFRKGESKHRRSRNPEATSFGDAYSPTAKQLIIDSDPFYSTFHTTPDRRRFSKEEWEKFTRETTKSALEGLVSSPDFSRWAVAHADRITLTPTKDSAKKSRRWLHWS